MESPMLSVMVTRISPDCINAPIPEDAALYDLPVMFRVSSFQSSHVLRSLMAETIFSFGSLILMTREMRMCEGKSEKTNVTAIPNTITLININLNTRMQ